MHLCESEGGSGSLLVCSHMHLSRTLILTELRDDAFDSMSSGSEVSVQSEAERPMCPLPQRHRGFWSSSRSLETDIHQGGREKKGDRIKMFVDVMCRLAFVLLLFVEMSHQWMLPSPGPCLRPAAMRISAACGAGSGFSWWRAPSTHSRAAAAHPSAVRIRTPPCQPLLLKTDRR